MDSPVRSQLALGHDHRVNSDELAHSDEEDFSAVLRRMEEVAQR